MEQAERNQRRTKQGTVVSNKMERTVVVSVSRTIRHPVYGKVVNRKKKYYAHTDDQDLKIGQIVTIMETKPISKLKRWRVVA